MKIRGDRRRAAPDPAGGPRRAERTRRVQCREEEPEGEFIDEDGHVLDPSEHSRQEKEEAHGRCETEEGVSQSEGERSKETRRGETRGKERGETGKGKEAKG